MSTIQDELRHTLALVLAGGKGSRLMQLTERHSKPAVPFGGKFRIIDFPLSNCVNSGIKKIAVLTQYRAHWLILHLQRGWNFLRPALSEFVEIWPAQQQTIKESWYQGTADAVFQNLEAIAFHRPRYVLILAGDHIYKQDYAALLAEHIEREADVTVSCLEVGRGEPSAFGVVDANSDGQIVGFVEKPEDPPSIPGDPDHSFVSMGIYIFNYETLMDALQADELDSGSSHDFGKDIIPGLVGRAKVMAHRFENSSVSRTGAYWRDVGTVDAYWEANIDLVRVSPQLDLYDTDWPIWTYQRQLPAAKFVFNDGERRGYAVDSLVSAGCIVSGGEVNNSLLFTDSRVNSYSQVNDSLLLPHSSVGRNCRINKAVVGIRCHLPEGLVVGEDVEADAARFYRSENGVTLITASMVEALEK
ncbi:MAG: glucose-1-phosphate adenylyltransferase [Gammaproteobacteria bacterium]|nr:glucose-1-phosphate adenylyltransferase [Gammaproteobacteria bacterium]